MDWVRILAYITGTVDQNTPILLNTLPNANTPLALRSRGRSAERQPLWQQPLPLRNHPQRHGLSVANSYIKQPLAFETVHDNVFAIDSVQC